MNTVIDLLLILRIRGKIISMVYSTREIGSSTTIRLKVCKLALLTSLTCFSRFDGAYIKLVGGFKTYLPTPRVQTSGDY